MENPHVNPLDGKSGNMAKLLAALTREELQKYIAHYQWEQQHQSFPANPRSPYKSESYYRYRTSQWIHDAQQLLDKKQ